MKYRLPFTLLFVFAATILAKAQEFGGNPPSVKWKQVNTPAAKVIFPNGLDSAAIRIANIVQHMNGAIQPTIGYRQKQISIVLQNQTTVSNAYVGLAPFRSEFYLTPEQNSFDIGSLPWPEQLAIHEFRHVQQYNNFNVGLSHVLKVFFGEGGQALGNDLAVPNWFFEGDAVFNETHVSEQGRGRLPYFFKGYRAIWAAGRDYSYMKLRNGSYRDYIPDWYPLGYMLVAYGREKYGDDFWKKVTHDAAAYKDGFYPFQKAVKKYAGIDFKTFRRNAFDYFKKQFNDNSKGVMSVTTKHFDADREYPAYVDDSTIVYMKTSYSHVPAFIAKTGNVEKKIGVRSFSLDNYFDYRDGKIVYAAYRPDLRWNYRDYSELMLLDVKTGKERRLTQKTKYFSPDFSADGKTIVAVEESTTGKSALHLVSAMTGKITSVIPNLDGLIYTYPKFYGSDKIISAVRDGKGKMSLAKIDIHTGNAEYLLPFTYQPIVFPAIKNDTIYFSAATGVNDRLFEISLKDRKLHELADYNQDGTIGSYEPAVSNTKFAWVGFTDAGYKILEKNRDELKWEVAGKQIPGTLPNLGISALKHDKSADLLAAVKNDSLPVTKYRKSFHLFNFHSLIPNFTDPNYTLYLAGENVLNTLQSQLSFTYNRNEGYKQLAFDAIYGALFPYISAGASYTLSRRGYDQGQNVYWNETNLHGGLELPLNFSAGRHLTTLHAGTDLYYTSANFQHAFRNLYPDRSYTYLNHYLNFSNSTQQASQNIYPRLAQSIMLDYKSAISNISAQQFLANGLFYLPGFIANHSLVINVAHQEKNKSQVIDFSNDFPFSRGYTAENLYNMNKAGVSYHFPIAYPDAGVANTIYLMRLRGNLFYDYTKANDFLPRGRSFEGVFRSTGAELYFDAKLFNQGAISFGFRYSYLIDKDVFGGAGRNRFEIIVPVTVF